MNNLLKTIFYFEWIQLKRQPAQWIALAGFVLISCYAIYTGNSVVRHQRTVIDTLERQYGSDYDLVIKRFTDTLTPQSKAQAAYAGLPQVLDYRIPPLAVNRPTSLASLSIGQRDIQPYYQKVKSKVDFLDHQNVELSNPSVLFAGNFDLSFVLIYLLPLLIIALCYNTHTEEKEQGTHALLSLQSGSMTRTLAYKLLFRMVVVLTVVLVVNIIGLAVAGITNVPDLMSALLWMYLSVLYASFWFAVCYCFLQLGKGSITTALSLTGVWMFFLVVLPSLSNSYLSLAHPVPLRADLASFQRRTSEQVWDMKPVVLVDSFNLHNPQYASSIDPAKDSTRTGERFIVGYYDLLERRVARYARGIQSEFAKRSSLAEDLASVNPGITMQYLFNDLARTGRKDHQHFEQQISLFQKKWKHHLYQKQLIGLNFKREELKDLPRFALASRAVDWGVLVHSLTIWAAMACFLLLGIWMQKRS